MWKRLRAIANHPITPLVLAVLIVMDLWCLASRYTHDARTHTAHVLYSRLIGSVRFTPRCIGGAIYNEHDGSLALLLQHEWDIRPDVTSGRIVDYISTWPGSQRNRGTYAPTYHRHVFVAFGLQQLPPDVATHFRRQYYQSYVALGELPSDFSLEEEMDFIAGRAVVRTTHLLPGYLHNTLALGMLLMLLWSLRLNVPKLWHRRDDPTACARCGYSTAGLTRGVCPECGKSLQNHKAWNPDRNEPRA